jgi:predicted glycoside hydrolase/deacetylase ChbG (UPF0249 family)
MTAAAQLIVNADDYGLTEATSRAIIDCHRHGVCTSTSLLTLAPAFASTVDWLADVPELGVGVHLALVGEDPPLLPPGRVPSLVDADGALMPSWREFMRRAATGRVRIAEVEAELAAQVDLALSSGVRLTHLDSHQHLHQWPTLFGVVRRLAAKAGVRAVRTTRSGGVGPLDWLGRLAAARARRAGLGTTERFLGFSESGRLTEAAMLHLLDRVPDGIASVEIGCHPGADVDEARGRYDWGFHWAEERACLMSERVAERIAARGLRLSTFGDLR